MGRDNDAINVYHQAFNLLPNSSAWLKLAELFEKLGKNDELLALYDRKIRLKPDNPNIWYKYGLVLIKLENLGGAIDAFDNAIQINTNFADAFYNQACAYALQQNKDLAVNSLRRAIELDGEHYRNLAQSDKYFDNLRYYEGFIDLIGC
ncbi:MAG: tetratricopeptide repeat protein [Calothrix sp. SM1_7_51]|nr:tetratricopeptide repeat protein [Calothrix sp. SM1_7_51]